MAVPSKFFPTSGALAAALAAVLAPPAGCAPADEPPSAAERVTTRGPLAFQSFEEFRATVYREPWEGGLYIVDRDVPIRDDDELRAYYERLAAGDTALVIGTVNGKDIAWPVDRRLKLTYCIDDDSMSSAEKRQLSESLDKAASNWEAIADVDFVHVTAEDDDCNAGNDAVLFDVHKVDDAGDIYFARAFFPDYGRNDRRLNIAAGAFDAVQAAIFDDVMTHEFGHILGFQHEHGRNEATTVGDCGEDTDGWLAVTPYDGASVMHYPECLGKERGTFTISPRDEQGVRALYGSPGRLQPVDAVATTYRYFDRPAPVDFVEYNQPFRARAGTTLVAVLKGESVSDDPDLFVGFDSPEKAKAEPACLPAISQPGVPEACRVQVEGADRNVFVGRKSGGGAPNNTFGLTVVYVPAG